MSPKDRILKSLLGKKPDILPAAPCYLSLFLADFLRDYYIEQYRLRMKGRSRYAVDHAEDTHFRAQALYQSYGIFKERPDWIEVGRGASKSWAERMEIVSKDNILYYEDKTSGLQVPMKDISIPRGDTPLSEMTAVTHDVWDLSEHITSREDVDEQTPIQSADELLARGDFDLARQVTADYGDQYFISTIMDTPFSDAYDFLGFRGLMVYQRSKPDLLEYLLQRRLAQVKEIMRAWAAVGVHGVFVEEVFTGADIISPQSYERFVFAYNKPYFQHMRASGLLPIHYVCGDVVPRLKYMVEYDVAALAVEESKKKFHIEIGEVVQRIAGRVAVFGNIDAVQFGINATAEEMSAEVRRQAAIGAQARGFIVGTGSPFPLETNPRVIDALVAAAHSLTAS